MRRRHMLAAACLAVPPLPAPLPDLLALFDDLAPAQALGRHALAGMHGVQAASLAASLWRELAGAGPLRSRVAAAARRDFAAGRVVCVDGWMLASTEARLCALAALSAQASQ